MDSIDRNLQAEDKAFDRQTNGRHAGHDEDDDGMRILAAGPVTITHNEPGSNPTTNSTSPMVPPPPPPRADPLVVGQSASPIAGNTGGADWLKKAAVAAALLAGGAGAGLLADKLLSKPTPTPAAQSTPDSSWQLNSRVLDKP